LVFYHIITQRHIPEDLDLNLHGRGNLKSRDMLHLFCALSLDLLSNPS
jgi:hypothetical protein